MKITPTAIYSSSGSWGGLELNTARLTQWMLKRHHPVFLFCLQDSPLAAYAVTRSIPHQLIPGHKRYLDLCAAQYFKRLLDQLDIRILMLVDNRDLEFGVMVKYLSHNRIKLVYQQHMRIGIPKKDLVHTYRYRKLDAWITLLPYMKEEIVNHTRYPEERIHLIPLGVDTDALLSSLPGKQDARKQLELPGEGRIIGILGRLDRQKGQHLVIEALHRLKQKGIPVSLLVMGETTRNEGETYPDELRRLVSTAGLQQDVFFRGYHPDAAVFYSAVDLFVLGSYEETYGMVTIESMVCGIPVIGSRSGGTPELLGNGRFGWLYKAKDPADLAIKISQALEDPQQLKQVADLAKDYAISTFSHTRECNHIESLLESLG